MKIPLRIAFLAALIVRPPLFSQQPDAALVHLQPQSVVGRAPEGAAAPQPVGALTIQGRRGETLRMFSGADVEYAVPEEAASFGATLAFSNVRPGTAGNSHLLARLLLRVLVDGKVACSVAADYQTPLVNFTVPLVGAHRLTLSATGEYASDFYLQDAGFFKEPRAAVIAYRPPAGTGYVSVASEPRQAMYRAYYPNEEVAVSVSSAVQSSSAGVQVTLVPEQTKFEPVAFRSTVSLRVNAEGAYDGTTIWRVPPLLGPAQLDITASASGKVLYHEQRRIAVIARNDLTRVSYSVFGIHSSTTGYLVPQDEFAYIWGAKWARVALRWSIIERRPGVYDFSRIDSVIDTYRAQHMDILAVLGEDVPAWLTQWGPEYISAWKKWIAETVRHLQAKVSYWDVFNEVDVKRYGIWSKLGPDVDLSILRSGIEAVRSASSRASVVCCSTGTYHWLEYDKRLFDAGLLKDIDILSLHPYMRYAPEDKDPVFSYPEKLTELESLARSYGQTKPVWSTEANWIMGPRGARDVTAPDIDEHTLAEYVARVNLLSSVRTVPYFLHAPMNHHNHMELQLDELSAYANVTSLLSTAKGGGRALVHAPDIMAFAWDTRDGVVGAMWTDRNSAEISVAGAAGAKFVDIYGNVLAVRPDSLRLSTSPIYFIAGSGSSPTVTVKSGPPPVRWTSLPPLSAWKRTASSTYSVNGEAVHVVTEPATYDYELVSPPVSVKPGACYLARIAFRAYRGGIGFVPQDPETSKTLGDSLYGLTSLANGQQQSASIRFKAGQGQQARFVIIANNPYAKTVTEFDVSRPAIASCPDE